MLKHNYAGHRVLYSEVYREVLLYCSSRRTLCLLATAFIAGLTACGSSKPTVPGPPPATQHLYTNGALGHTVQFALPLTGSNPTATWPNPAGTGAPERGGNPAGKVPHGDLSGTTPTSTHPKTGPPLQSAKLRTGGETSFGNLSLTSPGNQFPPPKATRIKASTNQLTPPTPPPRVITGVNFGKGIGTGLDSPKNRIVRNPPALPPAPTLLFTPPPPGASLSTPVGPPNFHPPKGNRRHAVIVVASLSQLIKNRRLRSPDPGGRPIRIAHPHRNLGRPRTSHRRGRDHQRNPVGGPQRNPGPAGQGPNRNQGPAIFRPRPPPGPKAGPAPLGRLKIELPLAGGCRAAATGEEPGPNG